MVGSSAALGEDGAAAGPVHEVPPEIASDAALSAARRRASDALDVIYARAPEGTAPLAGASASELGTVGALSRAATPASMRDEWRRHVARASAEGLEPPWMVQIDALDRLARDALSPLRVRWHDIAGTPTEVQGLGFVLRDATPPDVLAAFLRARSVELAGLYGIADPSELELLETRENEAFTILRLGRVFSGVPVRNEGLDVFVTNAQSPLGAGVLWGIAGTWTRDLAAKLPAGTWASEATARSIAGTDGAPVARRVIACATWCRPIWEFQRADAHLVSVDGFAPDLARVVDTSSVAVLTSGGVHIQWGNGTLLWPNFEDIFDVDVVMFRAIAGVTYEVSAGPVGGSPVDLNIAVYRLQPGSQPIASGHQPFNDPNAVIAFTASADDWYLAYFSTRSVGGIWHGYIKTLGDDYAGSIGADCSATTSCFREAYPMPSGVATVATLKVASDKDAFKIYCPVGPGVGGSMTFTASPSSGPPLEIYVYKPDGTLFRTGYTSVTVTSGEAKLGEWRWVVREVSGVAPRTYTTSATLGCASGGSPCDNLTAAAPIATTQAWGDRVAGRLESGWTAGYTVSLGANQHASFSLPDVNTNLGCQYQLALYGPTGMVMFGTSPASPIFKWRDGPASNDPYGNSHGVAGGGHIIAPFAGDYRLEVSAYSGTGCWYRLQLAENPAFLAVAPPTW